MAKNQDIFFTVTPQHTGVKFTSSDTATDENGSTGTLNTLCTAGSDDTIVRSIVATSTDSAKDLMLFLHNGSTYYHIGIINVPANSGFTSGTASVNVFNTTQLPHLQIDKDGNRFILLKSGWTIKVGLKATLTSAKQITVLCTSEDF